MEGGVVNRDDDAALVEAMARAIVDRYNSIFDGPLEFIGADNGRLLATDALAAYRAHQEAF